MARSRNIKPSFFTNDALSECSVLARLLFIGLWTIADREGRFEDRPKKIKAELLPYDSCDCNELMTELHNNGFIMRYNLGGSSYVQILKFTKHQQPHYKEVASVIPAPQGWVDSGTTPGGVPEDLRQEVLARDGKCLDCGSKEDLTLDHIKPRSLGGSHDIGNLQTLCRKCNSSKNNKIASTGQSQAEVGSTKVLDDTLIPLTLNLIPSSLNPHTDSLIPNEVARIWNEIVGDVLPKVERLSPSRKAKIQKRISEDFGGDMGEYEKFCKRVRGSPFLTGDGWRASFDWCLESKNITKVLEGNYDGKAGKPNRHNAMLEGFGSAIARDA